MKSKLLLALLAITLTGTAAAQVKPEDAIKFRQSGYTFMAWNMARIKMNVERIQYWLGQGAQPTDRIARMLEAAGIKEKTVRNNPKAAVPGKRMADLAKKKAARAAEPVAE